VGANVKFDILPEAHRKLGLGTDLVALRRSTTTDDEGRFELRAVAPLTDEDSEIVVTLAGG
jgi:hypothetical protein